MILNKIKDPYYDHKDRSVTGKTAKWKSCWLTSGRFFGVKAGRSRGYTRRPEYNSENKNVHTLFRKEFVLKEKPASAKVFITGDDVYKLYLNSSFVGEGPSQSYPSSYNYNCYDVTDLLTEGVNAVGVHVYYQGLFNIYLISADDLSGFIAQIEITYKNGETETIKSDGSWKYTECGAYTGSRLYGYQTQFSEDIDMNLVVRGWYDAGFDDSGWHRAYVPACPYPTEYTLVPQITPPVEHMKMFPKKTERTEEGYLFDFGEETVGNLVFRAKGEKGSMITVYHGEELLENGRVRHAMRANCNYEERITLSGEDDLVTFFDYKGFRYAEIVTEGKAVDPESVYCFARNYPFPSEKAEFSSSDELMNAVWDICERGVRIGTQDTYFDCPTREKGGFVGDALITGLSHLILTGDVRIYRKFILDCAASARICPAIMAHLPTYVIGLLADYSALVPLFLEEYYRYTGDAELVERMLPVCEGILDHYSRFKNDDMLFERLRHEDNVPESAEVILVDWPQNLRDGYDFEKAKNGVCTVINVYFYGFIKTLSGLYGIVGDKKRAAELEKTYKAMGESIIRKTYDEKSGLFTDTPDSLHSSLHANALQMFYGLVPPKGWKPIVDLIRERRLNCGVYFSYFVIKGLYNIGEDELAFDLLTGKDEHSWYNMVKEGATTCMEAWGAEQKWNTSWCHPWSSSPVYFYVSEIMGIKCGEPGMKTVKISPKIGKGPDGMRVRVPLPQGFLTASFERKENEAVYTVSAPEGVDVAFEGDGIRFIRE